MVDINDPKFDIKALLKSTDIGMVKDAVQQFNALVLTDNKQVEQNFKVQILLWNRILQLYENKLKKGEGGNVEEDRRQAVECYHQVSKLWANLDDRIKAISQLHRALEVFAEGTKNETQAETLQLLGNTYLDVSNFDEAIKYYEKYIQMLSDIDANGDKLALAYSQTATVYQTKGDYDAAIEQLQKGQQKLPDISEGDVDEDEDYFAGDAGVDEHVLAQEAVYCQLGKIHFDMANYAEAVKVLTPTVKVLRQVRGKDDDKTKEFEYLLEMSTTCA